MPPSLDPATIRREAFEEAAKVADAAHVKSMSTSNLYGTEPGRVWADKIAAVIRSLSPSPSD